MIDPAVVRASGLRFSFGKSEALRGLDLEVARGETFGLVGPDGAGKTTLIRIFCGLLHPSAGTCRVLGFDTVKEKARLIRRIGYLSQRFSLYGDLSVEENIDFFAEIHGCKGYAGRKNELLESMDLLRFKKRLAGALSGGMKQKLALAVTLIHTPEILFLDEPTNGVDPVARREFWDILAGISADGVTIVISTPYLDEAERCRRLAFMDGGRIIKVASPDEARTAVPGLIYEAVCDRVAEARTIAGRVPGAVSVQAFGDKIHVEMRPGADGFALRTALSDAVAVSVFRTVRPTLEDVFFRLLSDRKGEAA
ncbi:MAG: ABC transporter ATP-binding protein [Candidatus Aminicenantes bacterium]|nr:ABC transporter ATP-binding protein [Candidatus Aminicenantes bacterium]